MGPLCEFLNKLNGVYIIFGDFNFPDIRWETGCAGTKGRKFLETIHDKFLSQHVDVATHDSGNILDLILSSEDELVRDVEVCGNIGKSDHAMINCKVQMDAMKSRSRKAFQNFRKANLEGMRDVMRKDWRELMESESVNGTWSILKQSLETAIAKHVPTKKVKRTDEPKWLDAEMRKKI